MLKKLLSKFSVLILSFVIALSSFSVSTEAKSFSLASFYSSSFASGKNKQLNIRYSSIKAIVTKNIENPSESVAKSTQSKPSDQNSESKLNNLAFSIPAIGLDNISLAKASVMNLPDLDQKMLSNPIFDTLTSEPCLEKSSSYILGHSEPASKAYAAKPAVRIFKDLDQLKSGDKVQMQNSMGAKCTYNVIGSEIVTTDYNNGISPETFNRLYFPQVKDSSILRIQTCIKGSTTKRLIVTAIME